MTTADHFENARTLYRQGDLARAAELFRQVVGTAPEHAQAWHMLGVIAHQQGQHDWARQYIEKAIAVDPREPRFHNNLGEVHRATNQLASAVACYQAALRLRPDYPEANNNLGATLLDLGRPAEAEAPLRLALAAKPDSSLVRQNLGRALTVLGKTNEAAALMQPGANNALQADLYNRQGNIAVSQGKVEEAYALFLQAVQANPVHPEAFNNLGNVLQLVGRLEEAIVCFRHAVRVNPQQAEIHNNLGIAVQEAGRLGEAVECFRRALQIKSDYGEAWSNLANAFRGQGLLEETIAHYRRARELRPQAANVHSNLLLALQYDQAMTPAELAKAHAEWDQQHAGPAPQPGLQYHVATNRPMRVGIVSADLGFHPVGRFCLRGLEAMDHAQCELFCYSDRIRKDAFTARFEAASTGWRNTHGWTDDQLLNQIRNDRIEILIDLAGHTSGNRLTLLARKPAPIQATWIGYEGTTGLGAMNYLLADSFVVAPEAEPHMRERVLRLPHSYICFEPPDPSPPVGPLPAAANGHITFGCFNHPLKIQPWVVRVWSQILRRLPTSRLILKYDGLLDATARQRIIQLFAAEEIAEQRLELLGISPHPEFLAAHQRIDIGLDPFPFSGGVTTCDALWMGIPIITHPGATFASRHGLSYLTNVGLTETIAHDLDHYVTLAVELAQAIPRLAAIRSNLRERVARSPLCDGPRFAADFVATLNAVRRAR